MLEKVLEQQPPQAYIHLQFESYTFQCADNLFKIFNESGCPKPISVLDVRSPSPLSFFSSLYCYSGVNIISYFFNDRKSAAAKGVSTSELGSREVVHREQHGGIIMGCDVRKFWDQNCRVPVENCCPSHLEMSNCFEVLARSAIVSTKREGCDQLGQGYTPIHNVKLEWPSGMSSSGEEYESSFFNSSYMGDNLDDRRGMSQHLQHYHSKQVSQGSAHMSTSGVMKEPLDVSMESSMVINAENSREGGNSILESTKISQIRAVEEQCWVDVLAPGSMVVPSTVSQHEFGVNVEDLESMLLTQPADHTIMKWLMGDGQAHGQGDNQLVHCSRATDAVMFEQDSWSSNQHQSGSHLEDNSLSRPISRDICPSLRNSSISLSPIFPKLNSGPNFLHSTFTSLPRASSLPSHLHDITLNSPKGIGVSVPSTTATSIASMDEPSGHPFSAPSSFIGALSVSPNASAAEEYYAQSLLVGNSTSDGQFAQRSTYRVHETSLVMEGHAGQSVAMQDNLLSSDTEFEQRSIIQRSISSLASIDSENQQIKIPAMMSHDYLLQRQRSWRMSPQLQQLALENRSLKVTGDWKPGTWKNRTGGALSLLSSEDVKLDTGQMEGGVIPEGVIPEGGLAIVNLLLRAAEAVDIGNAEMAKVILARLNQHISPTREKSIHRVAHYFREALVARIMGVKNFMAQLSQDRTLPPLHEFHKINAYVRFCEVSPYPKFAHFTANQAILEALEKEEALHVIDFHMGAGAQWASFLQDIASLRTSGKLVPRVRLTAVGTRTDEIHATGANLCNFARTMNIALEFQAVLIRPECLNVSMLGLRDNEAVAANFIFSLHELLDGETSNGLSTVLKVVLEAHPKVVTTVEQEANHSGPFFQQRFSEALQYYMFLFDSLSSSLEAGGDSSVNSSIESYLFAPEIMNIVACDGVARVQRHERLGQWRDRMLAAGFSPRPLSDTSQFQAEKLVTQISARRGFKVTRDQGSLLLGWQGRPLLAASSWIC